MTTTSSSSIAVFTEADLMTAEQLLQTPVPNMRTELVRGRLMVREPASHRHGEVAARILTRLAVWLEADQVRRDAPHALGYVLAAETGFTLARDPDTVRASDVAFVRWDRRPASGRGYPEMAPDLAVEVLSPDDRPGEALAKVADWLRAGTSLVWTIDPERRIAQSYGADGTTTVVGEAGALDGGVVLPGFTLMLADALA